MKTTASIIILGAALWAGAAVAESSQASAGGALGGVLQTRLESGEALMLRGLVCAGDEDGVAWVAQGDGAGQVLRRGGGVSVSQGDGSMRLTALDVTPSGVIFTNRALEARMDLPSQFTSPADGEAREGALRHVEFNKLPLGVALRMLANQSGANFTATRGAASLEISYLAWNVTADEVVAALCRAHRLWAQRDEATGGTLLQTLAEFREDLEGYAPNEHSRVFELLHPQASEVASVIYGLYAGRVELYLGDNDILEDDLNDLGRRIDRFNLFSGGNSDFMNGFAPGTLGNGGRGTSGTAGGVISRGANGEWERIDAEGRRLRDLDAATARRAAEARAASAAAAEGGEDKLDEVLADSRLSAPRIYVTLSRANNLLFVRSSDPRALDDIEALVKRMDVPSPMVLLDVKVLEVSLDDQLDTVFDFTGSAKFHYDGHHEGSWNATFPADKLMERGLTFNWITEDFLGRIQLLREKGNVKVMATPTLLTVNNEVSQLFMGRETPIVRNVTSQTVVTENNVVTTPQTQVEFVRVGTLLLLTPNVNSNGTVTLRLVQENSEISAQKAQIPIVNTSSGQIQYYDVDVVESRSVSGTFVAQDRQTVAIGGMVREKESDVRSGIPVLMDIPLLGWFFRSTSKQTSRDELVVLVTPYVVRNPADGEDMTREHAEATLLHDATLSASGAAPESEKDE